MTNHALFSSRTDEWETPQNLFDDLDQKYHFTLDVCASKENTKCKYYFTKDIDGLSQIWGGRCWMNPPYGKEITKWVEKALQEVGKGHCELVVGLLPARTDTRWWHSYVWGKSKVEFLKGRLKFGEAKNFAPFPSCVAIWSNDL